MNNVSYAVNGSEFSFTSTTKINSFSFSDINLEVNYINNYNFPIESYNFIAPLLNYHGDKIYQVKGDKRFNALKYMNIYYRYYNLNTEGEEDSKYLGI